MTTFEDPLPCFVNHPLSLFGVYSNDTTSPFIYPCTQVTNFFFNACAKRTQAIAKVFDCRENNSVMA